MIEPKSGPSYADASKGIMHTRSGVKFSLLTPRAEDVLIDDIAEHLSKINRFTGATNVSYSVGEHSVRVYQRVSQWTCDGRQRLAALLHDGAEAYCGDMSKPMKDALRSLSFGPHSVYDVIESRVMDAIKTRFDLPLDAATWALVKRADNEVYVEEAEQYMTAPWAVAMPPRVAFCEFMRAFAVCIETIEFQRRTSLAA